MATCRVQTVLQGASNLPEDRFINTFHFHIPGAPGIIPFDDYSDTCLDAVSQFWLNVAPNDALGSRISPFVKRAATLSAYNLELPEGEREPKTIGITLGAAAADSGMPEEVAICLTMHGAPPVTPRRRGRLFIGPIVNGSQNVDNGDNLLPSRVQLSGANNIGGLLAATAVRLSTFVGAGWSIRSVTPAENFVPIVGGWIDNAFDIQRRRGPDPTARTLWGSS